MKLSEIKTNRANPRFIRDKSFMRLCNSVREFPKMMALRPIVIDANGTILGGNMRYKALCSLGYKEIPDEWVLRADELTDAEKRRFIVEDNVEFGEWDTEMLSNEWELEDLKEWGVDLPGMNLDDNLLNDSITDTKMEQTEELDDGNDIETINDVLYDSDNEYEIPNLRLDMQGGKLAMPLNPWGANSRLRKDIATYHFYVDDYRFNALWKNPSVLVLSGCRAIVEPNCSLHDQTPIAFGLHLIYKKRWLARFCQECGISVYADLNVSQKFVKYNRMGIPKGYNAFFTRGLTGWITSLESDLKVAQEISGMEIPNLIVYGGGKDVREFCQKYSLLYVTDFINAKKKNVNGTE